MVEERGIPTICTSSALDITALVMPPRSVFINFPLGHTTGKPFDRNLQMSIIKDAFDALKSISKPGAIIELPYQWKQGDDTWEREIEKQIKGE